MKQTDRQDADLELKLIRRLPLGARLERLDAAVVRLLGRIGIPLLRIALGIVFLWFGALKLLPEWNSAKELVANTVYFWDPAVVIPLLAVTEILIGLGLIFRQFVRTMLVLLLLQMAGTALPMVLLPHMVFTSVPFDLTLEGQYIVKNLVLITAAIVVGSTVRGEKPAQVADTNRAAGRGPQKSSKAI